jgi:hypothetical protein
MVLPLPVRVVPEAPIMMGMRDIKTERFKARGMDVIVVDGECCCH